MTSTALREADYKRLGDILHSITVENETIEEIYDVAFVPGVKHMMISGLNDDLSEQMITIAPARK